MDGPAVNAPRVAWPEAEFAIGDRVRWHEADPEMRRHGIVRWEPYVYGWVRYVFEDGTVRVRSDAGEDDDRHPDFRNLEPVSAVDALAGLVVVPCTSK